MKPLRSIRWRLLAWYGPILTLIIVGLGVSAYHFVSASQQQNVDEELQRDLGIISRAGRPRPHSNPQNQGSASADSPADLKDSPPPPKHDDDIDLDDPSHPVLGENSEVYYAVWLKNGKPLTTSPNAPADVPRPPEGAGGLRTRGSLREAYITGQPGDCFLVGRSIAREQTVLTHFGLLLAGGCTGLLALGLAGGWWIVTRSLKPIEAITRAARKISDGDLSQRIDISETESELGELAGVLNSTFARLDAAFAQQTRFTADAAHELRTPVSVILTHAQNGLAESDISEEQREAFEACQRSAQRMRQLIDMLLQLARLDSPENSPNHQVCDLAAIVQDAVDHLSPLAKEAGTILHLDLKAAEACGQQEGLGVVVSNLLANAIHHGRSAGGEVWISTSSDTGVSTCAIRDNGPGIAKEHLSHIFERFYRVDKARTTKTGRTGLGLAISEAIIRQHGGTIGVVSEIGQGATFVVRLPRRAEN